MFVEGGAPVLWHNCAMASPSLRNWKCRMQRVVVLKRTVRASSRECICQSVVNLLQMKLALICCAVVVVCLLVDSAQSQFGGDAGGVGRGGHGQGRFDGGGGDGGGGFFRGADGKLRINKLQDDIHA